MKKTFIRVLSIILSLILILTCVPTFVSVALFDSIDNSNSAIAPEGYTPSNNKSNAILRSKSLSVDNKAKVLLIQDNSPWNTNSNETVLNKLGISYKKVLTNDLSGINLWDYDMAIIANDQTFNTYQNFKEFKSNLDLFVNLGGVIIFGAAGSGWANGDFDWTLPGGVKKTKVYTERNKVADKEHPIVTGILTDSQVLADNDLYGNYCSHADFDESTLPKNSNVIIRSSSSNAPTLVEYPLGNGHVIASTLTWEFYYVRNDKGDFSKKSMDDLFAYGLSLCGGVQQSGEKMKIKKDNNSFSHSSSNFFKSNEKQVYQINDAYFDKLNSYYDESLIELLPFTKNTIQKERVSEWGGSCLGLSVSMALTYMKEIGLNNFDGDASDYYHADMPKDNQNFRSLINYYQLSQYVPCIEKKEVTANVGSGEFSKELETIVNLAKQSNKTNIPFIFTFGWSYSHKNEKTNKTETKHAGHAIVCIGVEVNKNGYRLKFIDPNSTTDYVYAQVKSNFNSIEFETIYKDKGGYYPEYKLNYIGYDTLSIFKPVDIDGASNQNPPVARKKSRMARSSNNYDVFKFNSNTDFEIIADDGKTLIFDGADISGTMEIMQLTHYEKGNSVDFEIAVGSHKTYTITLKSEQVDISVNNQNNYYAFSGSNAKSVVVYMNNGINAKGSNMDCDVYFGGVNGKNTDMVRVSNGAVNNINVFDNNNSINVECDNIKNCDILGFYNSNIYNIDNFDSNNNIISISKDNDITDDNIIPDGNIDLPSEPNNPSASCKCMCHKTGFIGFIYKIARFFWKLFKTHKVCDCGIAHY